MVYRELQHFKSLISKFLSGQGSLVLILPHKWSFVILHFMIKSNNICFMICAAHCAQRVSVLLQREHHCR